LNEISLHIATAGQAAASVRLLDRGGEVHVAVRANSPQLAATLRADVEQLASRLNSSGWNAAIWKTEQAADQRQNSSASSTPDGNPGERRNHRQRPEWAEELEQ
jgi:hypothetical protein